MNQYKLVLRERSESYIIGEDVDLTFVVMDEIGEIGNPDDWTMSAVLTDGISTYSFDADDFDLDSLGLTLSIPSTTTALFTAGNYRLEIQAVIETKTRKVFKDQLYFYDEAQ